MANVRNEFVKSAAIEDENANSDDQKSERCLPLDAQVHDDVQSKVVIDTGDLKATGEQILAQPPEPTSSPSRCGAVREVSEAAAMGRVRDGTKSVRAVPALLQRRISFAGAPEIDDALLIEILQRAPAMRSEGVVEWLLESHKDLRFFTSLGDPTRARGVCRHMTLLRMGDGERIFNEGDAADAFYIIRKGQVRPMTLFPLFARQGLQVPLPRV